MTHYEFKSSGEKGRNKYQGSWTKTAPKNIDLPFTIKSMELVLTWGANPSQSPYTHQDITHWCDQFNMAMLDIDTDGAMDLATEIALEIEAQWDMFLGNSYKLEELRKLDFSKIRLPVEWFNNWLKQLNGL